MELKDIKSVYFVGAGGIGMSAIARYFISRGIVVAGYDKTPTELTHRLEREGALLHYEENVDEIPHVCKNPQTCLVVYTPAIPDDHKELVFFREGGFEIQKRAQVLGTIARSRRALCVAAFAAAGILCELLYVILSGHGGQLFYAFLFVILKVISLICALTIRRKLKCLNWAKVPKCENQ